MKKRVFSFPLMLENLKRFWGFSAVAFIAYFMTSSFVILLDINSETTAYMASKVANMISGSYPPFSVFDVIVPVVAAVLVFGYLSKVNSSGVMHSMPFSRSSLFISNYLSGLILCIAPIVINAIILLIIRKPVYGEYWEEGIKYFSGNLFTGKAVVTGMMLDLLSAFFTYSIACFAGMLSGNRVIHLLTAFTVNFIFPITWVSFMGYKYLFLDGYMSSSGSEDIALAMHPVLYVYSKKYSADELQTKYFDTSEYVIYLCIAILISLLAYYLYSKRKLERAGDSYVFDWTKYVVAFFFTYLPAIGLALMLEYNNVLLGLVIGGAVGFIIGWMIINKSFRVFNLKAIKALLICGGITALIAVVFSFDLTGYSKRIPQASDVESVEFTIYDSNYISDTLYDPGNIQSIIDFHQQVIDSRAQGIKSDDTSSFYVSYRLKNGKEITRCFDNIPRELFLESAAIKSVFESDELDDSADELRKFEPTLSEITINADNYYDSDYAPLFSFSRYESDTIKSEIIQALADDLAERSFDEFKNSHKSWGYVWLSMSGADKPVDETEYIYSYRVDDPVTGKLSYTWDCTIAFNDDYEHLLSVFEKYDMLDAVLNNK